jgi:CheY-like chemotaxis protein
VPPILADKGQLETALVNLATNGRDAMPGGGRLTIAAEAETVPAGGPRAALAPGCYVRITVADTGTGMDEATLAHAAEPFFTTKGPGTGTGLGVPMAMGFAQQSGGAFSIASSPGEGTAVTLWLPAAEAIGAETPNEERPPQGGQGKPSVGVRVLLVDDEELLREVLAEQLAEAGYSVLATGSGAEAIALLEAGEDVDALITDLSMPGMDGLALIRTARQIRPGLPAVLLTGYAEEGTQPGPEYGSAGEFSPLRKPIRLPELTGRLQSMVKSPPPLRSASPGVTHC